MRKVQARSSESTASSLQFDCGALQAASCCRISMTCWQLTSTRSGLLNEWLKGQTRMRCACQGKVMAHEHSLSRSYERHKSDDNGSGAQVGRAR
eukprot:scaffold154988_cov33-Tisochrysis_lutea.AAC.1